MTLRKLTLTLLSLSLSLGMMHCASSRTTRSNEEIFFPQLALSNKERAFPDALIEGPLHLSRGCLRVGANGEGALVIWPPHVRLDRTGDSIRVLDERSRVEAQVGQAVKLGGGEIESTAPILRDLREPLLARCPGPYWLASGLISF